VRHQETAAFRKCSYRWKIEEMVVGGKRFSSEIQAWFKKGSGTVAAAALRVLCTTVPDPFLNHVEIHDSRFRV